MASDQTHTTIKPPSDTAYWLWEYQKALVNVRGLVSRGMSESAVKMIDDQIARWQQACIAFPPRRWAEEIDCG